MIRCLRNTEDLEKAAPETRPIALAWDLAGTLPEDWTLVRRLRHSSGLSRVPFMLFGQSEVDKLGTSAAMTGFVLKSGDNQSLIAALETLYPLQVEGPILIVDDEPQVRRTPGLGGECPAGLPGTSCRRWFPCPGDYE